MLIRGCNGHQHLFVSWVWLETFSHYLIVGRINIVIVSGHYCENVDPSPL